MKRLIRQTIQGALRKRGFEIRQTVEYGKDPLLDMLKLCPHGATDHQPVIFDIGANVGDVTRQFAHLFGSPRIHSFEPDPDTFKKLQSNTADLATIYLNNCGLGAIDGELTFKVNDHDDMSSFLSPNTQSWGQVVREISVPVRTIDTYCREKNIDHIHILKTDTQGYDLQVLRGAEKMIEQRRIQLIFMEVNFAQLYKGQPRFDEIYAYLHDRGFCLVTLYPIHYLDNRAGWTDALFTYVPSASEGGGGP